MIEGRLAKGFQVETLRARVTGSVPERVIEFRQDRSAIFRFEPELAPLYAALGHEEGALDLELEVRKPDDTTAIWRLGNFAETDRDGAVDPIPVEDTLAWIHVTGRGNMSLHFGAEVIHRLGTSDRRLVTGRHGVEFSMTVETFSRPIQSVVGTFTGRQSNRRFEFPVTVVDRTESRMAGAGLHSYDVKGTFFPGDLYDIADTTDRDFDPLVEVRLQHILDPINVQIKPGRGRRHRIHDITIVQGKSAQILLPSLTFRAQRLVFQSEYFGSTELRFLRRLRWVSWMFVLIRPFLGIWLVGEVTNKAQDNGYRFFHWLRTERPGRRAYFVIDRDSPDRPKVEPLGNVLIRHSRQHILYSLLASRFVASHHAEYLFASRMRWFKRRCHGWRIFLQHGVISTKDIALNYGRRHMDKPFDVVVVSSPMERQIVIQELGYFPSQVKVTGLARFDTLLADDIVPQRRLLVMPTWRDWLSHRRSFERSKFRARWSAFLTHPELTRIATENNLSIELVLHPNMQHFADLLDFPGVTIRHPGEDIQALLKSGSVLITDYSSVHWDFSFLERPVLYYQFDRDFFLRGSTSYVDLTTHFPGDIAYDEDHLVGLLQGVVDRGMTMTEAHRLRSRVFMEHRDRHNCERIEEVVLHAATWRVRLARWRSAPIVRRSYDAFRRTRTYHRVMTWAFRFARLLPRRDLVVFESDQGNSYGGSPRALHERLLQRGTGLEMAVVNNTAARVTGLATRKIRRLSPRYYWDLGRARYWVFNQNVGVQFRPSRRTYFLQTWHGTPLKKMQQDLRNVIGRDSGYLRRVKRAASYWTALVSPSPFATAAFRSAFGYTGPVLETGYPVNDVLLAEDAEERRSAIRGRLGIHARQRVVLYAPTFRDDQRQGSTWAADMMLDLDDFVARLDDDTILLVRFHPLVYQRIAATHGDRVRDVSRYPDAQELLLATDVLITDYSSIMFDFALTGRPMIFFTYDIEHYRDTLRGFYFDFEAEAPGPLVATSDGVIEALQSTDENQIAYADRYAAFVARFGGLEDGHATDRVLDAMLESS